MYHGSRQLVVAIDSTISELWSSGAAIREKDKRQLRPLRITEDVSQKFKDPLMDTYK